VKLVNKWCALAVLLSITLISFTGCGQSTTSTVNIQSSLSVIQQYKYLIARFYGSMTFDFKGTPFTFPTELTISSVPVTWMGQIFDGSTENNGPGNDVTDEVHGSVSADGKWVLMLSYSRQIARPAQKSIFYRVTLKNVPIDKAGFGTGVASGTFDESGDVQKYIDKIEYMDGIFENGQITPSITYISTDWSNPNQSLQPALKIAFEQKPSQVLGPMPPQQPGMGMGR